MFTLEYAKDPVWNDDTEQSINLIVKWAEFNEELPFAATSFDPMPHGVDLYNRAKNGEFGQVAPYVASPVSAENQPQTQGAQNL